MTVIWCKTEMEARSKAEDHHDGGLVKKGDILRVDQFQLGKPYRGWAHIAYEEDAICSTSFIVDEDGQFEEMMDDVVNPKKEPENDWAIPSDDFVRSWEK